MRLILTTIILTMLAQPVWADSVGDLVKSCTAWKNTGFKDEFTYDDDGMSALMCQGYLAAMANVGGQNCNWTDVHDLNFICLIWM